LRGGLRVRVGIYKNLSSIEPSIRNDGGLNERKIIMIGGG
jgi:hypothetical protein